MNAHFIDIDILIKTKSMPWIVSKDAPNIPILKIEKHDFNLFLSGIYKNHNNKLEFNGKTFWLSKDFMNKIKIKSKNNNVNISTLAISMQEFLNKSVIENIEFDIDMSVFNSIINSNDDIYIICSKNTKNNYEKQISKLEENLKKIGLNIKNYYFISETFYNRNSDDISFKKARLLLQHIVGLKSNDHVFTNEEITSYNKAYFYDDNKSSIELTKNINTVLENLLIKTEENIKDILKKTLRDNSKILSVKEYTHNKSRLFNETIVKIEYNNIVKRFENFRYK